MSKSREFVEFVMERMAAVGSPHAQGMFGGYGVYLGDRMVAIIVDDQLYFKSDSQTRGEFEALGLKPFSYWARGKLVVMSYYEASADVFEDADIMRIGAERALGAAKRAEAGRRGRSSRRKMPAAPSRG